MTALFRGEIAAALGLGLDGAPVRLATPEGELPSIFAVADLAAASLGAAAGELAALLDVGRVTLDRRLAQFWFGTTLRPTGWAVPSPFDPIIGDYRADDGWVRLHTNAPRHRAAALQVLGCVAERDVVAKAVAAREAGALEAAVVEAGGAAAAMRSLADWAAHPQGRAVAAEPLIAWDERGAARRPARMEGLRVLDLTRVLAGPVATRFLAGFGAEVLRIDPPWWDEPGNVQEVTLGKCCAGLDLRERADRAAFERLLGGADVLVHGYRPGALAGLGYDDEALGRLAPAMVEVTLDAYGWSGPWAGRRGFDSLVQMSCGIAAEGMHRAGADRPVPLPVQALDHATGYLMAAAALRALRVRGKEGRVMRARLSLARTAALLVSGGIREAGEPLGAETADDLAPEIEMTDWGPARRLAHPVRLADPIGVGGRGPAWPHPAGPLRRHAPAWG